MNRKYGRSFGTLHPHSRISTVFGRPGKMRQGFLVLENIMGFGNFDKNPGKILKILEQLNVSKFYSLVLVVPLLKADQGDLSCLVVSNMHSLETNYTERPPQR